MKDFLGPSNFIASSKPYVLLPFRFMPLDDTRESYVVTNLAGEYLILCRNDVYKFIKKQLTVHSDIYNLLKSHHFLLDKESTVALDLLAVKYRTRLSHLSNFTSLFMFVTTLRCDHVCTYCQVSRQDKDSYEYDMTQKTADKAVEFMFKSPSPYLKVEFQGGESLCNFEIVKHIVLKSLKVNEKENRDLDFVITSNLSSLNEGHLNFCKEHNIYVSTSLDGPKKLHNINRPSLYYDSYETAVSGIKKVIEELGKDKISALMTTTKESLRYPKEIVDEYIRHGLQSIFLRSINPYGYAIKSGSVSGYTIDSWLNFYKEALSYIIELNCSGIPFREEYTSLLLQKILTPYPAGYVDLQSPAGIGISCLVFNYDGLIYVSDEARMLAQMGDKTFCIGDLHKDTFQDVMLGEKLANWLGDSMSEGVPMCSDCGIQPYCGSDPVRHYAVQGDIIGYKPISDFCIKHREMVRYLLRLLEDNGKEASVLMSWI